jgi:hypothetical protein
MRFVLQSFFYIIMWTRSRCITSLKMCDVKLNLQLPLRCIDLIAMPGHYSCLELHAACRRFIATKINRVHSFVAASQGHRSLARASQSQLYINLNAMQQILIIRPNDEAVPATAWLTVRIEPRAYR